MKKVLAFLIIAALMIGAVLPVQAAEMPPESLVEEVYHTYMRPEWEAYQVRMKDFVEEYPDGPVTVYETYEAYCAAHPIESFADFAYLGSYAEDSVSVWVICVSLVYGNHTEFCGKYLLDEYKIHTDEMPALFAYADGELIYLVDAYEQGLIDDGDMDRLFAEKYTIGGVQIMRKVGDVDQNDVQDVADIMQIKAWLMKSTGGIHLGVGSHVLYDVDQNEYVDVGDIMALKSIIMAS